MTARHHRHHHHNQHAGRPAAKPAAPLAIVTSPAQLSATASVAATTSPTRRRCDALKLPSAAVHATTRVLDRAAVHMHEDDDVDLDDDDNDDDSALQSRFSKINVTDCDEDEAVVQDADAHHPLLSSSHDSAIDFDLYTTQLAAERKPAPTTTTKSVTFDLAHNTVRILPRDSGKAWKKLDKQLAAAGITTAVMRAFASYHLYEFHGEPVLALDGPVTPIVRETATQRTPPRSALKPVVNDLCVDHVRVARMCHVEDLEPEKAILLAWRDDWEIGMPVPDMEMPVRKSRRRRLLEEAAAKAAAALAAES